MFLLFSSILSKSKIDVAMDEFMKHAVQQSAPVQAMRGWEAHRNCGG